MDTDPNAPDTDQRLTRIEEALLFHERAGEDVRDATDHILARLHALERRLAGLEQRLGHLVQPVPDQPQADDAAGGPDRPASQESHDA